MAYTTLNSLLTAIAEAIRSKKGTTARINAQNFPSEIASISTSLESMLIATSNSNTVKKSGRNGSTASQETKVTFSPSYVSAIIACGASCNDSGGTGGLNTSWSQPKVYVVKEGTTSEVECVWNATKKYYEVPDTTARYISARAYVYGFSGSEMVHAMIGCLYVFGKK